MQKVKIFCTFTVIVNSDDNDGHCKCYLYLTRFEASAHSSG